MKVGVLKDWLSSEFTPFTWQRIVMRLLPDFRAEGLFFHHLTDDMELSDNLVGLIDKTLYDLYQTNLPKNLH